MDRSMYGKIDTSARHHPFRIVVNNGTLPGYALLADLQNNVPGSQPGSAPGYGSLNGRAPPTLSPQSPTYQNQRVVHETTNSNRSFSPRGTLQGGAHHHNVAPLGSSKQPPISNNLSELDTLLHDLSNAHYATVYNDKRAVNGATSPVYATPNGTPGGLRGSLDRPTVDSLLEELNNASPTNHYVNGDSLPRPGRQVTITVQETTTESLPGQQLGSYVQQKSYNSQENISSGGPSSPLYAAAPYTATKEMFHKSTKEYSTQGTPGAPASSATKELDDLMASLSDFKINASSHQHQTVTDSPYAKPNKAQQTTTITTTTTQQNSQSSGYPPANISAVSAQYTRTDQLDSMLGNLQADMSRQGVTTTQKGCCNACDKPIVGQVITALGKTWHPEHFTCTHCSQELGTRNFFERDGHPYCEPDYHNLFSPRCAYCNGPILDKCVTALEKTWHTEHFFCAQCGQQFGEEGFHERDGKPYCRNDYFDMFAPKCGGCNRPIMENYISALNGQWHQDCFVCRDCRQPFHGGSFFDHEGLPYCETHYHAKRGSLCAGCHKPIAGRCITAMFKKFHPEHFVCAFCLKQLNKGTFKEQNDKPYCHTCFDKLFG